MVKAEVRRYREYVEGHVHFLVPEGRHEKSDVKVEKIQDFLEEKIKSVKYGYIHIDADAKGICKYLTPSPIYSEFDDLLLERKNDVFIAIGKNTRLADSLIPRIFKGLEVRLNFPEDKLKSMVKKFQNLAKKVDEEIRKEDGPPDLKPFRELIVETEILLPFFKEHEKILENLKELANTENSNGVFRSLLNEIEEEKMYALETSIKTSSDAANLLLQHHTQQQMVNLEMALRCLYLFVGTYYITKLILLLIESYYGVEHYTIIRFLPMLLIIVGAFLFSYITLKFFKMIIKL
jgi:hypothetical protein